MRHYETDSSKAAARILAHALLVDGVLDQAELRSLARTEASRALDLDQGAFDEVIRHYCEDLMMVSHYRDAVQLRLPDEALPHLLGEIRDPDVRARLLDAMHDIIQADGIRTAEEDGLLIQAGRAWNIPVRGAAPSSVSG